MHGKNLLSAQHIRTINYDLAVETARTKQSGVENVGTVGRGDNDDAGGAFKAVHLHEQLVEGLLALVVSATKSGATLTSDGVDFIDEHDAGCMLLGLIEQIAHSGSTYTHKHFNEVRAGDAEKWHA